MATKSFEDFGFDARILKAISKIGWASPSSVQCNGIPLALAGRDLLIRASTGCGKTAVFALPIIQSILEKSEPEDNVIAIILSPTRELSKQIVNMIRDYTRFCSRYVSVEEVSNCSLSLSQVIVGTPKQFVKVINAGNLTLTKQFKWLVCDEADAILAFNYQDFMDTIVNHLSSYAHQTILVSATLSTDISILHNMLIKGEAAVVRSRSGDLPSNSKLHQFVLHCDDSDHAAKFLVTYALIKLRLLRGKTIIFVSSLQRCYSLKIFLLSFSIQSCILNEELPINSRLHILSQFNSGKFEYLIATDAAVLNTFQDKDLKKITKKNSSVFQVDDEFSVSRGIDFENVSNVVNFDFPSDKLRYIHRVGRVARAMNEVMPSYQVFVGRLSYSTRERDIERFFKGYGRIVDIQMKNRFCFCYFDNYRDADDAVYELNGCELNGTRVVVEHARSKPREGGRSYYSPPSRRRPDPVWLKKYGPPVRTKYRVRVENLSTRCSWQDLKDYCRQHGEITYADAHKDEDRVAHIEFATRDDMKRVMRKLNDTEINGRRIKMIDISGGNDRSSSRSSASRSRSSSRSSSRNKRRKRRRSLSKSTSRKRSRSHKRSRSRSNRRSRSRSGKRSRSSSHKRSRSRSHKRRRSRSRSQSSRHSVRKSRSGSRRRHSRSNSDGGRRRHSSSRSPSRHSDRHQTRSRSHSPQENHDDRSRSRSRSNSQSPSGDHEVNYDGNSEQDQYSGDQNDD